MHNDTIVISLNIVDYDVRRILVDNGSSTDILFYDAFSKISLSDDHLGPMNFLLIGFTDDTILVEGIITLAMNAG